MRRALQLRGVKVEWVLKDMLNSARSGASMYRIGFGVIRPDFNERIGWDGKKELVIDAYWLKYFNARIAHTGWRATVTGFNLPDQTLNLMRLV